MLVPENIELRAGETVAEWQARRARYGSQYFRIYVDEKRNLRTRKEFRKICSRETKRQTVSETVFTQTRLQWIGRDAMKNGGFNARINDVTKV